MCLLAAATATHAQDKKENTDFAVWRKRMVRTVYIGHENDSVISNWIGVTKAIVDMAMKGRIPVYKRSDLSYKLDLEDLKEQFTTQYDTVYIVDPVTNEERRKIVATDFDYTNLAGIKVCEEWAFDMRTKKTTIRITGIAPTQDVHANGGNPATGDVFWIKWADFLKGATEYKEFDPLYDMAVRIWKDYFKDAAIISDVANADVELEKESAWKTKVVRKTHLYVDTPTGYVFNLVNGYDSTILQVLYYAAHKEKITAYSDEDYERGGKLGPSEVKELTRLPTDGNTGNPVTGDLQPDDLYGFKSTVDFCVRERWVFTYTTGITEITNTDLAPLRGTRDDKGTQVLSPLYWFDYLDAAEVLGRYNMYSQPVIESQLWQDRFREKKH